MRARRLWKAKVVSVNEIDEYLSKGWEYVATLPNGKIKILKHFNPSLKSSA